MSTGVARAGSPARLWRPRTTWASPLLGGAALVFLSAFVWQFAGFLFNAVGAHTLGPSHYGTLAATLGLLALLAPAMSAVQAVASRETTGILSRGDAAELGHLMRRYAWRVCVAAVLLGGTLAAAATPIAEIFRLGSPWSVRLAGLCVVLYLPSHFLSGILQGAERFGRFASETLLEATAKIVFAVALLGLVWRNPVAGLLAIALSAACGLAVNVALVRGVVPRHRRVGAPVRISAAYSFATLATFGLLAALLSVDTLIAKHYLSSEQAGLYAGVSLTGKIVFFATSALFVVVFPIFSRHQDRGHDASRSLGVAAATALVIIAGSVAVLVVEPQLVVSMLLGPKYHGADQYVAWMGATFGLYALAYLCATYLLARRAHGVIAALAAAVACQLGGFYAFHSTIKAMIVVEAVAFWVAIAGCLSVLALTHPSRFGRDAGAPSVAESVVDGARAD